MILSASMIFGDSAVMVPVDDQQKAIEKGVEILTAGVDIPGHERLKSDKIDVTDYLIEVTYKEIANDRLNHE